MTKKPWGERMREKGYVAVQAVLLPETFARFEMALKSCGLKKRSDAVREAIQDFILKHEGGQN